MPIRTRWRSRTASNAAVFSPERPLGARTACEVPVPAWVELLGRELLDVGERDRLRGHRANLTAQI